MALTAGTRLGPYEILAPLGAGGMGEVYRARDTRLDRTVAIKILPARLSQNPDAGQRFQREAKAISSLQHPNICTLYDIGSENDVEFLVMECLEGETLQDRLLQGSLPLEQVTRHAMEIADALDAAHRKAFVHRDPKPSNVFLTRHGEAKVLDFGLVKREEEAVPEVPRPCRVSDRAGILTVWRGRPRPRGLRKTVVSAAAGIISASFC